MTHADNAFKSAVAELWEQRLKKTEGGTVKDDPFNCALYLEGEANLRGMLAMNRFGHRITKRIEPPWSSDSVDWSATDAVLLRVYLAERYGLSFSLQNVEHAVIHVASKHAVHPVQEYLESLTWDGQPRLDTWLAFYLDAVHYAAGTQLEYIYLVGRLWLIAAVARVYEPGCKFDNVLILEGDQGVGKSTALSIMAGAWSMDTPFRIGDKDAYQSLPGRWIVELAELGNFSGVESSRAKAFFSSGTDTFRPSYGRTTQDFRRQCVFAGTTNQLEYLKDSTGNRRYWPVRCHRLLKDELEEDRDQLWAEAFKAYKAGSVYHIPAGHELRDVIEEEQRARELGDPWEFAIAQWLASPDQFLADKFTLHDVLLRGLGVDTHSMTRRDHATRVGSILHRLGYVKKRATTREARVGGAGAYFYVKRDK